MNAVYQLRSCFSVETETGAHRLGSESPRRTFTQLSRIIESERRHRGARPHRPHDHPRHIESQSQASEAAHAEPQGSPETAHSQGKGGASVSLRECLRAPLWFPDRASNADAIRTSGARSRNIQSSITNPETRSGTIEAGNRNSETRTENIEARTAIPEMRPANVEGRTGNMEMRTGNIFTPPAAGFGRSANHFHTFPTQ